MRERVVIIPLKDNNGVRLDRQRRAIEGVMLSLVGGFTAEKVRGAWVASDGRVMRDESTRYTLAVTPEQDREIVDLLPAWRDLLRQEALYSSVRSADIVFV